MEYPFPKNPPHAPTEFNPVGQYLTQFDLPDDWQARETLIHFEGVDSAFYVWVNGHAVGYSQDSRTSAEFVITPFLQAGQSNLLAVEVFRWNVGSYLESQDMWRLSGIYRDVYLWSTDHLHIRDFEVKTTLDSEYKDAVLGVELELSATSVFKTDLPVSVEIRLLDAEGEDVFGPIVQREIKMTAEEAGFLSFSVPISSPRKWSAQEPYLYKMILTLFAGDSMVEVIPQNVGFRTSEIKEVRNMTEIKRSICHIYL